MKKNFIRVISLFISLVMVLSLIPVVTVSAIGEANTAWFTTAEGTAITVTTKPSNVGVDDVLSGTPKSEYTLTTAEQVYGFFALRKAGVSFKGVTIVLNLGTNKTVDLTGASLGNIHGNYAFQGTFDGNGHTISGVTIGATSGNKALFGTVAQNATIKNLTVNATCTIGHTNDNKNLKNTGIIAGQVVTLATATNDVALIDNVTVNATIQGLSGNTKKLSIIGGFVGLCSAPLTIKNSTITGTITISASQVGGFVGQASAALTISNCAIGGTINGNVQIGGFVGDSYYTDADKKCEIKNSVVTANITGSDMVGGFIGRYYAEDVTGIALNMDSCVFDGVVKLSGQSGRAGGMIGNIQDAATNDNTNKTSPTRMTVAINNCAVFGQVTCTEQADTTITAVMGAFSGAFRSQGEYATTLQFNVSNTVVTTSVYEKGYVLSLASASAANNGTYVVPTITDTATLRMALTYNNVYYGGSATNLYADPSTGAAATLPTNIGVTTAADLNGTNPIGENWTAVPGALPLPSAAKALYEGKDVSVAVLGSQYKDNTDGSRDYRIVAVVNNYVAGSAIGMNITIGEQTVKVYCTKGYKSITADGEPITAEDVGGEFFVTVVIKGVPTTNDYTVSVTPFTQANAEADRVNGGSAKLTWAKVVAEA